MSTIQKWLVFIGLLAVIATTFVAPFRVTLHDDIYEIATDSESVRQQTYYGPLWSPEGLAEQVDRSENRYYALSWNPDAPPYYVDKIENVRLDVLRLGLWWGAIVAVISIGVGIIAWKRHKVRTGPIPRSRDRGGNRRRPLGDR